MSFFKTHQWALYAAVFVGLCAVFPAFIAPIVLGDAYQGIQYMYQDDDDVYRARIHEILDGHGAVISPFMYEYKTEPANVAPIGEWLYALPAFVFGLHFVFVGYKFLLPAALFFLVYLFTRKLLGETGSGISWTSLAAGFLVTLAYDFVDYGDMLRVLQGADPRLSVWTRSVNPAMGGMALFAFLLLLWHTVESRGRWLILTAGVLLGVMVGYYFAWGMALALLGVLFLAYGARGEYRTAFALAGVGLVSLVAISPYLYQVLGTFGGDEGVRAAMRTGLIFTHTPVLNKLLLLATILVAGLFACAYWLGLRREHIKSWVFIGAMLVAGWLAFNEQIFTGRQIWYHHFVQYTIPFSYVAVLAAGYFSVRRLIPRLWTYGTFTIIALCGMYGLYTTTSFLPKLEDFERIQAYGPAMAWLEKEAPQNCVVLTIEDEERMAKIVPAYTHCDTYLTSVVFYATPDERIKHNFLLQLRLRGVAPEYVEGYLYAHELEVRGTAFTDWDELFGRGRDMWFEEQVQSLSSAYREFVQGDLEQQVLSYRVDYVLSKGPLEAWLLKQLPDLKEPLQAGDLFIYGVDH